MSGLDIISHLPYQRPFLFVDEISAVDKKTITGSYTFRKDEFFYEGHFVGHPVTPGVILLECMAQIGLVSHGVYLLDQQQKPIPELVAFTSADVNFLMPVEPGDRVEVNSTLQYFRLGMIKSTVELKTDRGVACRGVLSGMLKSEKK